MHLTQGWQYVAWFECGSGTDMNLGSVCHHLSADWHIARLRHYDSDRICRTLTSQMWAHTYASSEGTSVYCGVIDA